MGPQFARGLLFFLVALLAAAVANARKPVVIDCDGVSDDVRAITLALQTPGVEVLAIMTSSGSTNSAQAAVNVERTLRANNANVRVFKGADRPLLRTPIDFTFLKEFFGSDGLGDAPNAFPPVLQSDVAAAHERNVSAAAALLDIFEKRRDVTLVVTGPLTNIAIALEVDPRFAAWPAHMIIMGGNWQGVGNVELTTAESNFETDPEAAYIVLKEMKCNITLVTWESALFAAVQGSVDFYEHLQLKTPLSKFLATATRAPRQHTALIQNPTHKQYFYCDEITIGMLIDPKRMATQLLTRRASVELRGQKTRGQVAVDWSHFSHGIHDENVSIGDYRPVDFVVEYDVAYLNQLILNAVRRSE